jgi:hypothetical protein
MSHYRSAVRLADAAAQIGRSPRQVLRLVASGVLRRTGPGRRGGTWIESSGLRRLLADRKPTRRRKAVFDKSSRCVALSTLLVVREASPQARDALALAEFVQADMRRYRARGMFASFAHMVYTAPTSQDARAKLNPRDTYRVSSIALDAAARLTCRQLEYLLAVVAVAFRPASKVRSRRDDPEAFLSDAAEGALKAEHLTASGKAMGPAASAEFVISHNLLDLLPAFWERGFPSGLDATLPVNLEGLRVIRTAVDDARSSAGWRRFLNRMAAEYDAQGVPQLRHVAPVLALSRRSIQDIARRVSRRLGGTFAGIDLARLAGFARTTKVRASAVRAPRLAPKRDEGIPGILICPVCDTRLDENSFACPGCKRLVL